MSSRPAAARSSCASDSGLTSPLKVLITSCASPGSKACLNASTSPTGFLRRAVEKKSNANRKVNASPRSSGSGPGAAAGREHRLRQRDDRHRRGGGQRARDVLRIGPDLVDERERRVPAGRHGRGLPRPHADRALALEELRADVAGEAGQLERVDADEVEGVLNRRAAVVEGGALGLRQPGVDDLGAHRHARGLERRDVQPRRLADADPRAQVARDVDAERGRLAAAAPRLRRGLPREHLRDPLAAARRARPVHEALAVLVLERLKGLPEVEPARAQRLEVARDALRGAGGRGPVRPLEQPVRAVAAREVAEVGPAPGDQVAQRVVDRHAVRQPGERLGLLVLAALDPARVTQPRGVVLAQLRQPALHPAAAERVRARHVEAREAERARALDLALLEVPGRDAVGRVVQDRDVAEQLHRRVERMPAAHLQAQPLVLALAPPREHRRSLRPGADQAGVEQPVRQHRLARDRLEHARDDGEEVPRQRVQRLQHQQIGGQQHRLAEVREQARLQIARGGALGAAEQPPRLHALEVARAQDVEGLVLAQDGLVEDERRETDRAQRVGQHAGVRQLRRADDGARAHRGAKLADGHREEAQPHVALTRGLGHGDGVRGLVERERLRGSRRAAGRAGRCRRRPSRARGG